LSRAYLLDNKFALLLQWKLMEKLKIKDPVLMIVGFIGISYSIWYHGQGRILLFGNLRSRWMVDR
jgi:hypothetical protein